MRTIEEQIGLIADAALERSQLDAPREVVARDHLDRRMPHRNLLAIAATLLVLMLFVGLALTIGTRSDSTNVDQPVDTAVPTATNPPTVTYPSDQMWYVPADLSDDLVFDRAEDRQTAGQNLRYQSDSSDRSVTIESGGPLVASGLKSDRDVDVNGTIWHVVTSKSDPTSATWFSTVDDVDLVVAGHDIDEQTMIDIVGSLEQQPATSFPRPPIPVGGESDTAVEVAAARQDGSPVTLLADTDGISFVFSSNGGGGASVRLADHSLVVSGAMGPQPSLVSDGQEAESLIWGLVGPDVASIDVELTDGTVITALPQDESGEFIENFFLIAVPTHTEHGLELVARVVARDRNGVELERTDNVFG